MTTVFQCVQVVVNDAFVSIDAPFFLSVFCSSSTRILYTFNMLWYLELLQDDRQRYSVVETKLEHDICTYTAAMPTACDELDLKPTILHVALSRITGFDGRTT